MDPNTTLELINDSLNLEDYASARHHAACLREWLNNSGFLPNGPLSRKALLIFCKGVLLLTTE